MNKFSKKLIDNRRSINVLLFVLFLSILIYNNRVFARSWVHEHVLASTEETMTELYFDDHLNLPKSIMAGDEISFSFVIHNLEGRDMAYPYLVYKTFNENKIFLRRDIVKVEDGEYKRVNVSYTPLESVNNGIITVSLLQFNQDIHFLLSEDK